MKNTPPVACLFFFSLFWQPSIGSEALGVLPDSAEATAIIGGRLANLSDPSTARANPANMTMLDDRELQLNLSFWYGDTAFHPDNGGSIELLNDLVPVGSVFYVHPLSDKVVFGIGMSSPFGLQYDHPNNSAIRYVSPHEALLLTADISPSLGIKVNDELSVGFGLDLIYSKLRLKQYYPWIQLTGIPGTQDGELEYDGEGFGMGGFGGINWEFCPGHRLAFLGRLPVEIDYEGVFAAGNMPKSLTSFGFSAESPFLSNIEFPGMLGVGYGVDVTDRFTLGFDYQYFYNSSHDSIPLSIANNQPLLGGAEELVLNWEDTFDTGFGAQYQINECLELRGGFLYSSNAFPDYTYHPAVPSGTRKISSLGVGFKDGCNRIDLTYSYVSFSDRDIQENQQPLFTGDYTSNFHILNLSFGWQF